MNVRRKKKQYTAIVYYKRKLSLLGRDSTRQAKYRIFIVIPQAKQIPKYKKEIKKNKKQISEAITNIYI